MELVNKNSWWKNGVGYQIYPKSFNDSNNDGVGDINGIIEKIPYIKSLGVKFVWISPFFASPNVDNGYDVSNYEAIDPQYGTMDDVKNMISKFHKAGIKVVFDLVINHTSDKHEWFKEAKKSKNNPYHDMYIWKENINNKKPNNWKSLFGGSAWEYNKATNEYYYHLFAKEQPDLNWESSKVHDEVASVISWWKKQGVDGFRLDAISHLKKLQTFEDVNDPNKAMNDVPGIDGYLEFLSEQFKKNNLMTVGEAGGIPLQRAKKWVNQNNGYFSMIFQFDHVSFWEKFDIGKVSVPQLRAALSKWQDGLNETGWNALFIENHDLPRGVSYFGDGNEKYKTKTAKTLGMMYFLMKGTPFIYQGQELGMDNIQFDKIDEFRDLDSIRYYKEQLEKGIDVKTIMQHLIGKSRDNARTPMQWNNEKNAGFSNHKPWISVNPDYVKKNVALEDKDDDSVLNFYRKLVKLRLNDEVLLNGNYQLVNTNDNQLYVYTRTLDKKEYLIITNLSSKEATFKIPKNMNPKSVLEVGNNKIKDNELTLSPWGSVLYKGDLENETNK